MSDNESILVILQWLDYMRRDTRWGVQCTDLDDSVSLGDTELGQ